MGRNSETLAREELGGSAGRKQEAGTSSLEVRERFTPKLPWTEKSRVEGGNESRAETERQRGGELDFEEVKTGSKCWKEEEGGGHKKRKEGNGYLKRMRVRGKNMRR